MKQSFRLAPRAYDDLKNIARYTRQQWGEVQRERYMRALDERLCWLAEQPRAGKHRPEVAKGSSDLPTPGARCSVISWQAVDRRQQRTKALLLG